MLRLLRHVVREAGGVVTYKVESLSDISDGWILDHVTPNMARCGIPHDVCLVCFGGSLTGVVRVLFPLLRE